MIEFPFKAKLSTVSFIWDRISANDQESTNWYMQCRFLSIFPSKKYREQKATMLDLSTDIDHLSYFAFSYGKINQTVSQNRWDRSTIMSNKLKAAISCHGSSHFCLCILTVNMSCILVKELQVTMAHMNTERNRHVSWLLLRQESKLKTGRREKQNKKDIIFMFSEVINFIGRNRCNGCDSLEI